MELGGRGVVLSTRTFEVVARHQEQKVYLRLIFRLVQPLHEWAAEELFKVHGTLAVNNNVTGVGLVTAALLHRAPVAK